ncbi:MAG: hypothetical protein ACK51A_06115, partial [Sphingobacteriia bacterium]
DYWVVKLDANGNKQWDKTLGGSGGDQLFSLQQTADGGYILGGSSWSAADISGGKSENSRGERDYWVVKLDANGSIQWDKTLGGSANDELTSLQQTADGGYILGGWSESDADIAGGKSENSRGVSDYWVVKLDANGKRQWDKTLGGSGEDVLNSLQQTTDGGYILGGWSLSNADLDGGKSENSRGFYDYWVVKLDANGKREWDKTLGGSGVDGLTSLQQTNDGGYILGGGSSSAADISGGKSENSRGERDYWVVKLDANGSIQWDKTMGGSGEDYLSTLQQTADGGYILGGASYSNTDIAGGKSENSRENSLDYWIVKLDAAGNKQWDKTLGGSDYDWLGSLQQTTDGGYILGGRSWSNADIDGGKSENNRGLSDYWVVKLGCETSPPLVNLGPDRPLSCAAPDTLRTYYAPTLSYRWYTLAAGVEDPVPGA